MRKINPTEHRIYLKPGTVPISQRPYRAGPKSRKVVEKNIQTQLEENTIETE